MSLPIREYLAQRRADIQAQIKSLRAELAEVDVAERALAVAANEPAGAKRDRGATGSGRKTLKEMAVDVLKDHPAGLEAAGILAEIEKRWGLTVRRESLSPQLSRLGQDETLVREGLIWKLAQFDWTIQAAADAMQRPPPSEPVGVVYRQAQKDETPDVAASDASNSEVDLDDEIPF